MSLLFRLNNTYCVIGEWFDVPQILSDTELQINCVSTIMFIIIMTSVINVVEIKIAFILAQLSAI